MKHMPKNPDEWVTMLLVVIPLCATLAALFACPWTAMYLFASVFLLLMCYLRRQWPLALMRAMVTNTLGRLLVWMHLATRPPPPIIPMMLDQVLALISSELGMVDGCRLTEHPEKNNAVSVSGRRQGRFQQVYFDEHEVPQPWDERTVAYIVAKFRKAHP